MSGKDEYYNKAKQQGYRARSAYKLKQLDREADLLDAGDTVLDLGAAPGGWMQVAAEAVGPAGTVVGVDRQGIDDIENPADIHTVRADVTDDGAAAAIRDVLGAEGGSRPFDCVLSDMAPNMTGEYDLDHARSVHLARTAAEVATDLLGAGGDLVVKVFDGRDLAALEGELDADFEYVRQMRPDASRESSSELYLVGKGRLTAPVRTDDEREVEIVDIGDDGDGIARIEGFTIFVPGTEPGDTVVVRIEDVTSHFGFGSVLDD